VEEPEGDQVVSSLAWFPLDMFLADVYERLTKKGEKAGFLQLLATQVTSAVWHGLYPGYFLFFVNTAFMIAGSRGKHWPYLMLIVSISEGLDPCFTNCDNLMVQLCITGHVRVV
jgi:hypothetical protein